MYSIQDAINLVEQSNIKVYPILNGMYMLIYPNGEQRNVSESNLLNWAGGWDHRMGSRGDR